MNDTNKANLVKQIKAHAEEHYNDGGWDVIVECWSDQQISDAIPDGANNLKDALKHIQDCVDVWADRQADARNCI